MPRGLPVSDQKEWLLRTIKTIGCLAPQSERRVFMRSFTEECCEKISQRLVELIKRSAAARTEKGRELVVVRDAAIKAFMKDHGIDLQSCRVGGSANVDAAARAARVTPQASALHSVVQLPGRVAS
jgi:hypothetical protein